MVAPAVSSRRSTPQRSNGDNLARKLKIFLVAISLCAIAAFVVASRSGSGDDFSVVSVDEGRTRLKQQAKSELPPIAKTDVEEDDDDDDDDESGSGSAEDGEFVTRHFNIH